MDEPSPRPPREGRYFVALRPSSRARRSLEALAGALARRFGGRGLAADDIHLTLAFVGAAPASIEAPLRESLAGLPAPGGLALGRLGCFGKRLLWCGPGQTPEWLDGLAQALRTELDRRREFAADREPIDAGRIQLRVGTSAGAPPERRYRWLD